MRIGVIGDTLLDVDLEGEADRLAPDGPVPVVTLRETVRRPGGAGMVAMLLAADGIPVTLATALSDDEHADRLRGMLQQSDRIRLVATRLEGPTPVKTRLRAGGQPVARFDEGDAFSHVESFGLDALGALAGCDAIVVADYGRGVAADPQVRRLLEAWQGPLVWDPHPRGPLPVSSATVVTPNASEAASFGFPVGTSHRAAALAAATLADQWRVSAVAVTLAGAGAVLARPGDGAPHVVPTRPVAVADACGAGDRLAATTAVALAHGRPLPVALEDGVAAASAFVAAGGVASLRERRDEPEPPADAVALARTVHASGGTIVATGGAFGSIDADDVRWLAAARRLGDRLIVVLAEDDRRPHDVQDRRDLLLGLECVDAVVVGAPSTPLLARLRPDVWVCAGDGPMGPESDAVTRWGGCVVTVPHPRAPRTASRVLSAVS